MKNTLKLSICFLTFSLAFFTSFFKQIPSQPQQEYKILLCLSSFKRPIFLSGQIARLLNQTYNKNKYDISVSIKGSPHDSAFRNTFLREFDRFEKTGHVRIRFDKNKGQYANLLDTMRDIDLDKYDIYCKIDDDDWYSNDYVAEVNRAFNTFTQDEFELSSSAYHEGFILTENIKQTILNKNYSGLTGPTLCFSREIIKIAFEIEQNPSLIKKYIPDENENAFYSHEDRFLDHMARRNGAHIERDSPYPTVIYGQQYRSIMRNNNYVQHTNTPPQ